MENTLLEPKYKEVVFSTQEEFEDWLASTTYKELIFDDLGQDLRRMHIDERGEILHCNYHGRIYNGSFVNLKELEEFTPVQILEKGAWVVKYGLLINEIVLWKK